MHYYPNGAISAPQFAPQGWVADAVVNNAPLIGSGLGGLTTELTGSPFAGGVVGGIANIAARDLGHLIPFQAGPGAPVQYAPQGMWGNLIADVAPVVGGHVGGNAGRIISTVGGLADMLPFQAGPGAVQQSVYAPQGLWGNIISGAGGLIGNAVGGGAGRAISGVSGLGRLLPFQAGPGAPVQYAPQGMWGNLIADVAPVVGGHVGGNAGRIISTVGGLADMLPFQAGPGVGQQAAYAPQGVLGGLAGSVLGGAVGGHFGHRDLGSTVGGWAGSFLPFQAGPGAVAAQPAYAPQGMWGNIISGAGGLIGNAVGGDAGRVISGVSGLGKLLPFQAGPGAPIQYAPQGMWGNLIADVAPVVGNHIGGNAGRVISTVGGLADILPFQAGPGAVQQPVYAPQGLWGNIISGAGGLIGNAVGGDAGRAISGVSGLGRLLPFQAGPGMGPQPVYAPQGIFGSALGSVAGGLIGNALGNKSLGSAIGGIAGGFLPFQAGPGAPIQYAPVPTEQIVYH